MDDVIAALVPPAVVATVFCAFVVKLLRSEMAPRTMDGRPVSEVGTTRDDATADSTADAEVAATEGNARGAQTGADQASAEAPGDGSRSTNR